jgi:DNA end-binding protein Ku
MRAIWKGAISFGLVNIPIYLFTATSNKDVRFRFLHSEDHAPVRYKRVCSACGKELEKDEIVRGYEYEPGSFAVIEQEDLDKIPVERTHTIDITDFVSIEEIDPIFFDKTYYLAPGETGGKPYMLLRQAMADTNKIAVAKVVIRNKESLAVIRVYEDYLVMETIYYPDEIRNPAKMPGFDREIELDEKELKMARELIDNMAVKFEPEKYEDEYRKILLEMIRAKIEGEEITVPETPPRGKVIDLMDALRASVEKTKKTGSEKKPAPRKSKKTAG